MSEQSHYRPGPSTSSLAVVSLIFGILSWCVLPFIGAIVAIVCGHMARAEIRRAGPEYRLEGDGMAVAGITLGYLQLALGVLMIMVLMAALMFGLDFWHWH